MRSMLQASERPGPEHIRQSCGLSFDCGQELVLVVVWLSGVEFVKSGNLVFRWQKQRCHRSICFGDHPEPLGFAHLIAAQQAEPMLQAQFILGLVLWA